MPVAVRFILFQILIIGPFLAGAVAKRRITDPQALSKKLVRGNLIFLEPVIGFWTIWGLDLHGGMFLLPAVGLGFVLLGFFLGARVSPLLRLEGKSRATFIISSSISNQGFTMGGFMCFLMLGEQGLGLSLLYTLYFMPFVFLVLFPYAQSAATGKRGFGVLKEYLGLQNMPLYAVFLAFGLHAAGAARPAVWFPIDAVIMVSVVLYYFALGLNFQVGDVRTSRKEQGILALLKFVVMPLLTLGFLRVTSFPPEIGAVIFLQSFAPAAINSVITSVLFDLDARLASNLFVVNTVLFIIFVMPLVFLAHRAGMF